jgi:transposase InsO family protein
MDTCASEPLVAGPSRRQVLFQKKPDWVSREIIRLSAIMPSEGGQKIADEFNRLYGETKDMTVGKTWVCMQRRKHRYEILQPRKRLKHRIPRRLPTHHTWAMDLTGLPDHDRQSHNVFGIIDHGSRGLLHLEKIQSKASIALLRILLDIIERTGSAPKRLRTDNEAVFISRLFRFGLWWLGIKHQRSQPGHPWQNGRIERLFGTLKQKAKGLLFDQNKMQEQLHLFRFWYNHIRTHQHLHGKTPFEAYHQLPVTAQQADDKNPLWFEAWQGRLAGYWFKPG